MSYTFLFKYILLGNSGVGKSTFLHQNINNEFNPTMGTTIGVDFLAKIINVKGDIVKIHIWDTAGQETFRCIINSYYRDAIGAMVFYDITDIKTFIDTEKWIKELQSANDMHKIIIIGNKKDMNDKRQVTYDEGKNLAEKYDALFWEVSVKNNQDLEESIYDLTLAIVNDIKNKKYNKEKLRNSRSIQITNENILNELYDNKLSKKKKCC